MTPIRLLHALALSYLLLVVLVTILSPIILSILQPVSYIEVQVDCVLRYESHLLFFLQSFSLYFRK